MTKLNTEFESIQSQIDDLKLKQINMMKKAKSDTQKEIEKILEKNGFDLSQIFPDIVKKVSPNKSKIVIKDIEYTFVNRISNPIKQALISLKLDPETYTKQKLIAEFGV